MRSVDDVIVYSAPHCKACELVKAYLRENSVSYTEIDISQDAQACERLLKMTGRLSIPVVELAGPFVVGFSRRQLDELLKNRTATVDS